jgi:hypothetical protein
METNYKTPRKALAIVVTLLVSTGIALAAICYACNGTGTGMFKCNTCNGTGISNSFKCFSCNGKGLSKCTLCGGTGRR